MNDDGVHECSYLLHCLLVRPIFTSFPLTGRNEEGALNNFIGVLSTPILTFPRPGGRNWSWDAPATAGIAIV